MSPGAKVTSKGSPVSRIGPALVFSVPVALNISFCHGEQLKEAWPPAHQPWTSVQGPWSVLW